MSKKWYEVESVEVANGTVTKGNQVAVAVGEGRYGGGLRIGLVELVEAHDYEHRSYELVPEDDPRPATSAYRYFEGRKQVAKPPVTKQCYRIKVRVKNDSGKVTDYSKTYEYPQRIARMFEPESLAA